MADRHSRFGTAFTVRDKQQRVHTISNVKQLYNLRPQDLFKKKIKNVLHKPKARVVVEAVPARLFVD